MGLQSITQLNVDFYNKKYITINAKQHDKNSRFISIICYNHGELFPINAGEHAAYIRYKKSDEHSVFNFCEINRKGEILVELTEQMLACDGISVADLVIVNKGDANVDAETGEIIAIDNASILSTMPIHIDVTETATDNSNVESTYEFNLLNSNLETYWADFEDVMKTSKSWAVGNTGIRSGENTDNSKYYSKQSSNSASAANTSALNAANSEELAEDHMQNALLYSQNAKTYMNNAKIYMDNAKVSETNAKTSEENAKSSEENALLSETKSKTSENNALSSEQKAKESETNSKTSETNAKTSETNALDSANEARSYAVGGTGTRVGEDTDNSKWYYNEMKDMFNGLNIVFIPKGSIYFSELAVVKETAVVGYVYNIKDDFVTDETFREGSGMTYTAGTNIYYMVDENGDYKWDCFGGASSPTATVNEVKSYLGI